MRDPWHESMNPPGGQQPHLPAQRGPWPPQQASAQGQPSFTPGAQPPRYQPQPGYRQPQYAPPGPPQRRASHAARNTLLGAGAALVAIIAIGAAASHGTSKPAAAVSSTITSAAAPLAQAASQAPAAASAPADTAPAGTTSELQALASAQNYLSSGMGFSRQGLIDQLDSSYGSGFSVADATWGTDHSGANWDDQAVDSAKAYMGTGQGFSRNGLIQQMTSAYGSKFTEAQATYAANAVGL